MKSVKPALEAIDEAERAQQKIEAEAVDKSRRPKPSVSSKGSEEEYRFNVRTTLETKRGLETTARLRGLTVTSLINMLAVEEIRREKRSDPEGFERVWATYDEKKETWKRKRGMGGRLEG